MKCYYNNCNLKCLKIIGFCKLCNNKYCQKHRLYETHECVLLEYHKNKLLKVLKNKLYEESNSVRKDFNF